MSWPIVQLGQVASLAREGVGPEQIADGTLFVGLENIKKGGGFEGVLPVEKGDVLSTKFAFTPEHVLFGKLRPYLAKIASPDFSGVCSTDIIPIRTSEQLNRRYLLHYLLTPKMVALAADRATGANLPRLSPSALLEFPIPLPPIEEQRRIAAMLDKAEELRAKRRAALALLDELPQAIFREMFGDPATNSIKWPMTAVGEIADVQGGLQVTSARKELSFEAPYLRVANVYRGYLDLTEVKRIRANQQELKRTTLEAGDLLVVEGHGNKDEIGRVAIWDGSIPGCVHQNHIIRVRLRSNIANPDFAAQFLNSPHGRQALLRSGKTTSGLNTISVSDVKRAPIMLPPLELQDIFATRLQATYLCRATHQAALTDLDILVTSLRHSLLEVTD